MEDCIRLEFSGSGSISNRVVPKPSQLVSGGATVAQLVWCKLCPMKIRVVPGHHWHHY